jgi:DNA-binding phage protein
MPRLASVDEMETLRQALRRVHLGEAAVVERREELEKLLVRLRGEGVSVTELSRLTQLSRESVYKACRRAGKPIPRRIQHFVRGRGLA